jgi:hypothetical protein
MRCFDLGLHLGQGVHVNLVLMDQVVVIGQQLAHLAQPFGNHVEDAASGAERHFLLQPANPSASFEAHLAVVWLDLTGQKAQQGGFSGAIATDQGDAFARFDGKVHVFKQERSADAEVDTV